MKENLRCFSTGKRRITPGSRMTLNPLISQSHGGVKYYLGFVEKTLEVASYRIARSNVLVSNGFLPLLPSRGVVDGFLHRCRLVFVVGVDIPCHLCHVDSSGLFVEAFVFEFGGGKNALIWSCRRPCWFAC